MRTHHNQLEAFNLNQQGGNNLIATSYLEMLLSRERKINYETASAAAASIHVYVNLEAPLVLLSASLNAQFTILLLPFLLHTL